MLTEFPLDIDPYGVVLDTMGRDPKAVFDDFPAIRDDLKTMLLALICGRGSRKQAVSRADWRLFRFWTAIKDEATRRQERDHCKAREVRWAEAGLVVLSDHGKPSARIVLESFEKAHRPIRSSFSTGCSLSLQNIDATITHWVLFDMMLSDEDRCIPCLPVHDSFIAPRAYENTLRATMAKTDQHVMQQQARRNESSQIPIN